MFFDRWLPHGYRDAKRARRRPRSRFVRSIQLLLEKLEDRWLPSQTPAGATARASFGELPLRFEANSGQTDPAVTFLARGSGYGVFLTADGAVLSLQAGRGTVAPSRDVLTLQFVGAYPGTAAVGLDEQAGHSNYLVGNDPSRWQTNVANYGRVEYPNLYPGVDLVYYGNQHQLEYDFVVAAGVDPSIIQLSFAGMQRLEVDAQGNLVLHTSGGDLVEHAPILYQEVNGVRQPVAGRYVLEGDRQVGFQVDAYDPSRPLVIDPVLSYATYFGGSGEEQSLDVKTNAAGDVLFVGETTSTDFPTQDPIQSTLAGIGLFGRGDAFIAELDANGALVYSTYLGGSNGDLAVGLALDAAGNLIVTGETASTDFPILNAFQSIFGGGLRDTFVTKLNPTGSAILFSTYLGGSGDDAPESVPALDGSGNIYVAADVTSPDFPLRNPLQSTRHGSEDATVTELDAAGNLVYSTYLGGSNPDGATALAVDAAGNAYVGGFTESLDFPTLNAFQSTFAGDPSDPGDTLDGFVTKITTGGTALAYSTYLGGSGYDYPVDLVVDLAGNAYVAGAAGGVGSTPFPTTAGSAQPIFAGGGDPAQGADEDGFITKLNPSGSNLVYSTFLGGSAFDVVYHLTVDSSGDVYVAGSTGSSDFPTHNATQPTFGGGQSADPLLFGDGFYAKLNPAGSAFVYSSYLGGSGDDFAIGIALGSSGQLYLVGDTSSTDFPTVTPLQGSNAGGLRDAFVVRVTQLAPQVQINGLPTGSVSEGTLVALTSAVTDTDSDPSVLTYAWSVTKDGNAFASGSASSFSFTPNDNGSYVVSLTVTADNGLAQTRLASLLVTNVAPTILNLAINPLDPSFGNHGLVTTDFGGDGDLIEQLIRQPDGKLLAVGTAGNSSSSGQSDIGLARYNSDGSLDISFGNGGKVVTHVPNRSSVAFGVALQPDGKIVVNAAMATVDFSAGVGDLLLRYNRDGSLDSSFGSGGEVFYDAGAPDSALLRVIIQSDGRIVTGGYATVGPDADFALARFDADGTRDLSFGVSGTVLTDFGGSETASGLLLQSDGKLVLAGYTQANGTQEIAVARYNSDGSLDPTFATSGRFVSFFGTPKAIAVRVALQSDGKILLAGDGLTGTLDQFLVARLNSDGSVDTSFGSGGSVLTDFGLSDPTANSSYVQTASELLPLADGHFVVTGYSGNDIAVARYNADGSLDPTFDQDGKAVVNFTGTSVDYAYAGVVEPDGSIIAAGASNDNFGLAKFLPGPVTLPENGAANLVGSFSDPGTLDTHTVTIHWGDGSPDDTVSLAAGVASFTAPAHTYLNNQPGNAPYALTVTVTDSDLAADAKPASLLVTNVAPTILNLSISPLDPHFGSGGLVLTNLSGGSFDVAYDGTMQADGKILAAGLVGNYDGITQATSFAILRYLPDGNLDPAFGTGGLVTTAFAGHSGEADRVIALPDGKILAAGAIEDDFFVQHLVLVRYNSDGSRDSSFGTGGEAIFDFHQAGSNELLRSLAVQADGKIYAGGLGGAPQDAAVARFNANGALDPSFGVGGIVIDHFAAGASLVNNLAVQPDGKLLLVGNPDLVSATATGVIARLNPDGSLDSTFGAAGVFTTASGMQPGSVALQADGRIVYAGAQFQDGDTNFAVGRLLADGTPDGSFANTGLVVTDLDGPVIVPFFGETVNVVRMAPDGKIVAIGYAMQNQSLINTAMAVVRYNTDGSLDTSFDQDGKALIDFGGLPYDGAHSGFVQPDGQIVAIGAAGDGSRSYIGLTRLTGGVDTHPEGSAAPMTGTFLDPGTLDSHVVTIHWGDGTPDDTLTLPAGVTQFTAPAHTYLNNQAGNAAYALSVTVTDSDSASDTKPASLVVTNVAPTITNLSIDPLDPHFGSNGEVTTDFGGDFDAILNMQHQPDGKIVAVGRQSTTDLNGHYLTSNIALARYLPDGNLDPSFGTGGKVVTSIPTFLSSAIKANVLPNGQILVLGNLFEPGSENGGILLRYNADGSLDSSFGIGGEILDVESGLLPEDLAVDGAGRLILAEEMDHDGKHEVRLSRRAQDGSLDLTFGTNGFVFTNWGQNRPGERSEVTRLLLQPDGKIVLAGATCDADQISCLAVVARYNPDGSLDATFGTGGIFTSTLGATFDLLYGLALQTDGKLVVSGFRQTAVDQGPTQWIVARLTTDGGLDPTFAAAGIAVFDWGTPFDPNTFDQASYRVTVQPDGKIVSTGVNGNFLAVVRLDPDGSPDSSFDQDGVAFVSFPGTPAAIGIDVLVQPDGQILVGGGAGLGGSNYGEGDFALALFNGAPVSIPENGTAQLTGNFADPGTLDTHTVTIHWGDGAPDDTVNLPAGVTTFTAPQHTYLNNLAGNAAYAISVTVTDSDAGSDTRAASTTTLTLIP